ncbi:phosphoribosylanthranilate isomerase [Maridesulfovibrio ferrireducens]|uniref:N-(5'-phosphoribosyl)anthranilate isomerase n=1 Tax=Maridesulfovibrio ferrireducens TaxID=246191 RepID=A0A1G9J616_9BACT|nr:phosphoribosylanthranilate isomerase [Maridesulfovibrio ferrireducens]SDL32791.1 phosphoribosylanthranilate isomerase [Maridesulfovibrio ferrireducens]
MNQLIKVCGMTRVEDVANCEELGADFLGFIFHPSSPRCVDAEFVRSVEVTKAKKVGVFVKQSAAEIREIMKNAKLDFAQLHGGQNEEFCKAIGKERVIKVLWPQRYDSVKEFQDDIDRFAPFCSYMLFDAGSSGGGHGKTLDFSVFSEVKIQIPWLLAGGLSSKNLLEAISSAKPDGVDLNSGVEVSPGIKDINKLSAAFVSVHLANKRKKS